MALYRLGRASSIFKSKLRSVNGISGHISRKSGVEIPLREPDAGLLRHSVLMKAEMNSRSMLQELLQPTKVLPLQLFRTTGNIGQSEKMMSLGPLSPHLPIYKPQSSSMLSITCRITSVYLVGVVLAYSVIFLQMGKLCLTSFPFYQLCCYVAKLTPITMELAALALAYNIFLSLAKFGGRI